jgi:CRISPR-associated protein Csx10
MTLTLALRQSALISDRLRSDFVQTSQRHIPGTVARGAFAAAWLAAHGGDSTAHRAEFLRLFEGGVRFGPLFLDSPPTPLSVIGHKYPPAGVDCDVLEYDEALDGQDAPANCPNCESPLETPKTMRTPGALARRTSIAISPNDVARPGEIVTRDTLQPRQRFSGHLVADDPGLLDALQAMRRVQVGGRRTTHGAAEVSIDTRSPAIPQRRPDGMVILRLRSPGIFVDNDGRPARDPNLDELAEILGSAATIHRRWCRWTYLGGWHAASDLPKPTELAVAAGSTYLISAAGGIDPGALAALARRGLGLRRSEGFGDLGGPYPLRPGARARKAADQQALGRAREVARGLGFTAKGPQWDRLRPLLLRWVSGELTGTQVRTELRDLASRLGKLPEHYQPQEPPR